MRFSLVKIFCLSVAIFYCNNVVNAQEDGLPALNDIIEEIASASDLDLDYTTLFQSLEDLYYAPLNLNTASVDELREIIFLTEFQINNIINYRERNRGFQTLYELQFVIGLDPLTIRRLLPFVIAKREDDVRPLDFRNVFRHGRSDVFLRHQRVLQERAGYKEIPDSILQENPDRSRYLGSPDKLYLRYGHRYRNQVFWGFTADKDPGEQFFRGAQKYGFDFYSAHFQISDIGRIKTLVLGDFLAEFGQGLTLWSSMSFGKSSQALNVTKRPRGVRRYTSTNEIDFFRGAALTLNFGSIDITQFVSYKPIDASVGVDTTYLEPEEYVSSFLNTGFHRTPSEVARRKTVDEFVTGGNITWNTKYIKLGATGVYSEFSKPFSPGDQPYRYFDFEGSSNANFGVDYISSFRKVNVFGEFSMSNNGGFAMMNGALFDIVPEFKMSLIHRHYEPNYQALYSAPFAESNRSNNESGIFMGFEVYPIRNWRIDAYFDAWKHPWLRYGVHAPSSGYEYLVQLNHYPRRNLEMHFRFRNKTRLINNPEITDGARSLTESGTYRYRYHINYRPNRHWRLQSRVELAQYVINDHIEWGYLVYQDLQYRPEKIPMVFTLRLAAFDTDSWNTRIYAYEPDILYAFSIPAYHNQGLRTAFVMSYAISDNLTAWVKIANSFYNNQQGIGSGLDYIDGPNRTEIKTQIRYRF